MHYKTALKVLIIEDLKIDQTLIRQQVLKYNAKSIFAIANDRDSFLEKVNWFYPNLILADYHLPDFSGLEALLHLKEKGYNSPFIFITNALDDKEAVAKTVLKAADGHLSKDNLNELPQLLATVSSLRTEQIDLREKQQRQERKSKLKFLQINELIEKTPKSEETETLKSLLAELADSLLSN